MNAPSIACRRTIAARPDPIARWMAACLRPAAARARNRPPRFEAAAARISSASALRTPASIDAAPRWLPVTTVAVDVCRRRSRQVWGSRAASSAAAVPRRASRAAASADGSAKVVNQRSPMLVRHPRLSSASACATGTHASTLAPRKLDEAPAFRTPTIVNGAPLRSTRCPSTADAAPEVAAPEALGDRRGRFCRGAIVGAQHPSTENRLRADECEVLPVDGFGHRLHCRRATTDDDRLHVDRADARRIAHVLANNLELWVGHAQRGATLAIERADAAQRRTMHAAHLTKQQRLGQARSQQDSDQSRRQHRGRAKRGERAAPQAADHQRQIAHRQPREHANSADTRGEIRTRDGCRFAEEASSRPTTGDGFREPAHSRRQGRRRCPRHDAVARSSARTRSRSPAGAVWSSLVQQRFEPRTHPFDGFEGPLHGADAARRHAIGPPRPPALGRLRRCVSPT